MNRTRSALRVTRKRRISAAQRSVLPGGHFQQESAPKLPVELLRDLVDSPDLKTPQRDIGFEGFEVVRVDDLRGLGTRG